jgi:Tol biopolymer transport system component
MFSSPWRARPLARGISTGAAVGLLAGALASCSGEYDNPFENSNPMSPPSAAADIVFTANTYATRAGGGRDLFAMEDTGANLTRLTFCNTTDRRCDYLETIPGPARNRQAVRRLIDLDNDGRLSAADGESLRILDLSRAVEGELVAGNARVSGADWSPGEEVLYYSAAGQGGIEDLYQITSNGQSNQDLTVSSTVRERRPRFNTGGTALAYERIETGGRGQIWLATSLGLRALTTGGTMGDALTGTPYVVGSDADPVFSPDGRTVAFRRLVETGNGGLGVWDLMAVRTDVTAAVPVAIVTGAAFRGAPDWGPGGIVFVETVGGSGPQIVLVDESGSGRRVLFTAGAGFEVAFPRWLE